ncbi:MAG: hypothetical protein V3S76_02780, partial [Candidatus Bipolaricaulota bacterium]
AIPSSTSQPINHSTRLFSAPDYVFNPTNPTNPTNSTDSTDSLRITCYCLSTLGYLFTIAFSS